MNAKSKTTIVAVLAAGTLGLAGAANAELVRLDAAAQTGGVERNIGPMLQPLDGEGNLAPLMITSRSMIDRDNPFDLNASGSAGSIYVNDNGLGIQTFDGSGSKGISGSGGHQNEELIIFFDGLALAESIRLGFADYKAGDGLDDDDDTLVFVTLDGGSTILLDEVDYRDAFMYEGDSDSVGILDFASISPDLLDPAAAIRSVTVRETHDHMLVNAIDFSLVPGPGALALLGLAGLTGRTRRRR